MTMMTNCRCYLRWRFQFFNGSANSSPYYYSPPITVINPQIEFPSSLDQTRVWCENLSCDSVAGRQNKLGSGDSEWWRQWLPCNEVCRTLHTCARQSGHSHYKCASTLPAGQNKHTFTAHNQNYRLSASCNDYTVNSFQIMLRGSLSLWYLSWRTTSTIPMVGYKDL